MVYVLVVESSVENLLRMIHSFCYAFVVLEVVKV